METGIVTEIYEGGGNDLVFLLEDKNNRYYIKEGLENG